jgi:hypothetical protein
LLLTSLDSNESEQTKKEEGLIEEENKTLSKGVWVWVKAKGLEIAIILQG